MGQEKLILHQNRTIFLASNVPFDLCDNNCYQNCKVIVTKNLRWYYHLTMDEKWPNYRGMAAQYWMFHQFHLAFYFWWTCPMETRTTNTLPWLARKSVPVADAWGWILELVDRSCLDEFINCALGRMANLKQTREVKWNVLSQGNNW